MTDSRPPKTGLAPGERPTLKTISRLTGLATATVSRALHNAPDISTATKKRVRECADSIGYLPNRAGVRLRTGKTNVISLVLSPQWDMMCNPLQLVSSVAGALRTTPYHLNVTPFFLDEDPMVPIRYIVENQTADAIIIDQTKPEDDRIAYLMKKNFPFATHGRTNWCDTHPYADFDNREFARIGMTALARRQRKCVLFIPAPMEQFYGRELLEGCAEAVQAAGISHIVLAGAHSDSPPAELEAAVAEMLTANPHIDGILCASVSTTITAVGVAERCGHVIGESMDVFAKEALPFLERFRSDILVVPENVARAGETLAKATIQAIETPRSPPLHYLETPEYEDPLGS